MAPEEKPPDPKPETRVLNVEIPAELDQKFRVALVNRLGGRKGDLQKAVVEAIESWIREPDAETQELRRTLITGSEKRRKIAMAALKDGRSTPMDWLDIANSNAFPEEVRDEAMSLFDEQRKKSSDDFLDELYPPAAPD